MIHVLTYLLTQDTPALAISLSLFLIFFAVSITPLFHLKHTFFDTLGIKTDSYGKLSSALTRRFS
uniref:Putative ovule protein n=1 Tax=Solanum chacoense TaxID=4108 RepID=A0A0V0GS96_SOLCH